MFIAVVGCGHGEIDKIYDVVARVEEVRGIKVSLVLCCGDFQSVRNMTDLRCMACPIKYQQMHDFHRYYSGEKTAPITTVFIGGNHEASNYLQELPYGGWVAPNIFFLSTGIIRFGSIRIAGVSGIFKGRDYLKGKYEIPPYNQDTMRSVYHYRNVDIFRMKQVKTPIDIVMSHDWPKNIHTFGDTLELLRRKPFFRDEIERDELGSRPLSELLYQLQPSYWFSAHMHVKFSAVVPHAECADSVPHASGNENTSVPKVTKFLALDKILPRRQFLQVIEITEQESGEGESKLYYDSEWLAILKSTNHLVNSKPISSYMPGPGPGSQTRFDFTPTEEEVEEVCLLFDRKLKIPDSFMQTAAPFEIGEQPGPAHPIKNPQTTELCEKLGLSDPLRLIPTFYRNCLGFESNQNDSPQSYSRYNSGDESKIFFSTPERLETPCSTSFTQPSFNPDEISLDTDEEDESDQKNETYQSFTTLNSSSTSENLDVLKSSGLCLPIRKKLKLPSPKTSITEKNSEFDKDVRSSSNDNELQLLNSVLGMKSDSISEHPFFVIDKVGEPELKKRRNESLYKSLLEDTDSN